MLLTIIVGLIGVVLLYLGPKLRRFSNNYQVARATGLPVILCPYNPDSVSRLTFSIRTRTNTLG